jgi:anti-anti-sigma factor
MNVRVTDEQSAVRIGLEGRFAFEHRRAFVAATDAALASRAPKVLVDLCGVAYMDSSALGMLLVLRDKAAGAKKSVALSCRPGMVRDILTVANFGKLFALE